MAKSAAAVALSAKAPAPPSSTPAQPLAASGHSGEPSPKPNAPRGKAMPAQPPPELPSFDAHPVSDLVITNAGAAVELKLSVPSAPVTDILVLGAAPCSAGVSFAKHFVILGRLPVAEAGYSNITKLYVDRYGALTPGKRIFIRTRQVRDGRTELPIQTTALVPKP